MKIKHNLLLTMGILLLTSCGGEPVTDPNDPPDDNQTVSPAFVRDEACAANIAVTPTSMRRLTHKEYDNAVRDLLNTDLALARDFPGDLPAAGFASNRGDPLAELGAEKLMLAAEQHAEDFITRLNSELPCTPATRDRACAMSLIQDVSERAYRRSLTSEELTELGDLFDWGDTEEGFEYGILVAIEFILQSPNFLYHSETTDTAIASPMPLTATTEPLSGLSIAGRLAAMLWQSIPDEQLLQAAENGDLDTPAGIVAQAERMMADAKGRDGVVEFFNQWLDIEKLEITEKDPNLYPDFTPELREAMWTETTTFADYVIRQGDAQLSTLFTSDLALPTGPLAEFYNLGESDVLTPLDATVRNGILTHPSFLAVHAHGDQTSPVKRGVFIRDRVMCTPLPEPPNNVDTTPPEVDPNATTRERFSQHRADAVCAACHNLIDPLGFAFEHFDAMGQYRLMEGDLAIDTTGDLTATRDMNGPFDGINELNQKFIASEQVRDCMATQWLRYAIRQKETTVDACSLQQVKRALADKGNIKDLIFAVVQSDAFRYKAAATTTGDAP